MYDIIYTSSKYYDNNSQLGELYELYQLDESNKECIICWLPSSKDTPVKCMKEYSFYVSNCKCNVFFHDTCLNKWLKTYSSCPICRKKICINIIENDGMYIKITTYTVIFVNYTFYVLKMLSLFSMINLFFVVFYTIIFFDFTLNNKQDEYIEDSQYYSGL